MWSESGVNVIEKAVLCHRIGRFRSSGVDGWTLFTEKLACENRCKSGVLYRSRCCFPVMFISSHRLASSTAFRSLPHACEASYSSSRCTIALFGCKRK